MYLGLFVNKRLCALSLLVSFLRMAVRWARHTYHGGFRTAWRIPRVIRCEPHAPERSQQDLVPTQQPCAGKGGFPASPLPRRKNG